MRLIHPAEKGMYFDIGGYLSSNITIEESERILLTQLMKHSFELYQNGLGYNNLLFMSAVFGDMSLDKNGTYLNLFSVEEPEAHLHPQLQELIHNFFERRHKQGIAFIRRIRRDHECFLLRNSCTIRRIEGNQFVMHSFLQRHFYVRMMPSYSVGRYSALYHRVIVLFQAGGFYFRNQQVIFYEIWQNTIFHIVHVSVICGLSHTIFPAVQPIKHVQRQC